MSLRKMWFSLTMVVSVFCLFVMPAHAASTSDLAEPLVEADMTLKEADALLHGTGDDTSELAYADRPADEFFIARVERIAESGERLLAGQKEVYQVFDIRALSGSHKGERLQAEKSDVYLSNRVSDVRVGDRIVVVRSVDVQGTVHMVFTDFYRVPAVWWIVGAFFALAITFGRWRGFTSVLGLAASAWIIVGWLIPRLAQGADPLSVCLIATALIATVSLFLAHGFNQRTTVAYVGTMLTLVLSAGMAIGAVSFVRIFGLNSDESFLLVSALPDMDVRGLLLGGILLGLLGVLDDITTAQAAVVEELKRANPAMRARELYHSALSVGREHIASLVNTLFLAYTGTALPLFLLFSLSQDQPFWLLVNNEQIVEEILRTLVGSACLILAVPLTTALAAWWFGPRSVSSPAPSSLHHH